MKLYRVGQRVICKVTWEGVTKPRNCRIEAELLPGNWSVRVWSNWSQSYYSNLIDVSEEEIVPLSAIEDSWGVKKFRGSPP